jgi:nitric oxide reductase NorD protein
VTAKNTYSAEEAAERLRLINRDTAELFGSTVASLETVLSPDQIKYFTESCVSIADSGWRSFETVNLLLEFAALSDHPPRLMVITNVAEQLSGYSFEPAANYLQMVLDGFAIDRLADIVELEQAGLALHAKYPQASGLIGSYFSAARILLARDDTDNLFCWVEVARGMFDLGRDDLSRFLVLSEKSVNASWAIARQFQVKTAQGCLIYLDHVGRLQDRFTGSQMQLAEYAMLKHVGSSLEDLIESFESLRVFDPDQVSLILELGADIEHANSLAAFHRNAGKLPLVRQNVISQWVRFGNEVARGNELAGQAYFNLESVQSNEMLASLQGQVSFEDHRRTFDLLAEAITARNVVVESVAEASADTNLNLKGLRGDSERLMLPDNDGRVVRLPESVNIFEAESDNFGFYKVSLFHQLGYAEFGCFAQIETIDSVLFKYPDRQLAERLFLIAEDARIDWQLSIRYPGMQAQLTLQKSRAARTRQVKERTRKGQLLEVLVQTSLDSPYEKYVREIYWPEAALLWQTLGTLKKATAGIDDVLNVVEQCYRLLESPDDDVSDQRRTDLTKEELDALLEELPEPVPYRGQIDVEQVNATLKIEALVEALQEQLESMPDHPPGAEIPGSDQDQVELGDLKKGDVGEGVAMLLTELENELGSEPGEIDPGDREGLFEFLGGISSRSNEASEHRYDEWDYQISDYLSKWCTLFEHREMDRDEQYVHTVLRDHQDLARKIRQQLNKVKPEMLRKVKGVEEGEELDLERTISYVVDRRAGLTPDDNIYIQRQRKDRDVSTLFLLDMSASTDDIIPDPDVAPLEPLDIDDDEYLVDFFRKKKEADDVARRIIDVEKESVVLMADALENLGDAYSVCGFSGYGREQVDYYLCKDFDEPFNALSKGRIGGIKPCRSTRMGPPIRHATRRLIETGSRIKALIIMSDGYPQDHDYGTDRNSRDYGLMDTMKALSEAKQQGVLTYCLTVDPSGHDYLRAMCPDSQYMVIQDLEQLPEEVSRVYRSLTG